LKNLRRGLKMTWSHGYFCPNCECRWVKHLCKEYLPCGCGVKTEDAVYIYTKQYAKRGKEIYIAFKNYILEDFIPYEESYERAIERLFKKVENNPESTLLKKAIENAFYGKSLYWGDWIERCSKCVNFNPSGKTHNIHDATRRWRKKCKIHDWCSVDCKDFVKVEGKRNYSNMQIL